VRATTARSPSAWTVAVKPCRQRKNQRPCEVIHRASDVLRTRQDSNCNLLIRSPFPFMEGARPVTQSHRSVDLASDPLHLGDDLRSASRARQRCPGEHCRCRRTRTRSADRSRRGGDLVLAHSHQCLNHPIERLAHLSARDRSAPTPRSWPGASPLDCTVVARESPRVPARSGTRAARSCGSGEAADPRPTPGRGLCRADDLTDRLGHDLLIRSSSRNGQRRPYRPLRGPSGTLPEVTSAGVVYRRPLGDLVLRLCGEFGGQGGLVGFWLDRVEAGLGQQVESHVAAGLGPLVVLLGSTAPTGRINAVRSGKIPTTSVRRQLVPQGAPLFLRETPTTRPWGNFGTRRGPSMDAIDVDRPPGSRPSG
jgi:hypothetical protein